MTLLSFSSSEASRPAPRVRMRAEGVSVDYGRQAALRDVNLSIGEGEITALVGPSGCGKSTFLQTLNRLADLIPGCRVRGSVTLDGEPIYGPDVDLLALRRRVGMIFQQPNLFPLSIRRNLTLPLREHGMRDRDRLEEAVERVLSDVGLWKEVRDRLDAPASELSGGQQQRLCIARALALEPEVVLFDEPCSALDPLSSAVVEDLILSLRQRYAVVVVTHNLSQARRIADCAALFWVHEGAGRIIEAGPAERFFADPQHRLTRDYVSGARG
jgi:phosphate transport system ATP-binding protein